MPKAKPARKRRRVAPWDNNNLQFPRLLAEINACGLTTEQQVQLQESMDLTLDDIDELFERAEAELQQTVNREFARWKASSTRRQHARKKPA